MRILWHSNAPWMPTGYGRQTALFTRRLTALGHDVAISAFAGLQGAPTTWEGIPVYPGGGQGWGMDVVAGHYAHHRADLLITLMDTWKLVPEAVAGLNVACWTPVDCSPMGRGDRLALEGARAVPIAVSRFGEDMMRAAGLEPLYVPHGTDTAVFRPAAARPDRPFTVGMVAANQDKRRKGFDQAFTAFARFRDRHCPDARLIIHTAWVNGLLAGSDGLDLQALAAARGLAGSVAFGDQYAYRAGMFGDDAVAAFLRGCDVLLNPALGEGFGLAVLEAQACGVPVIVTRCSAMTELCGAGWTVEGEPEWQWLPEADWTVPRPEGLVRALGRAYKGAGKLREAAREFALAYHADKVTADYWVPALERLGRASHHKAPSKPTGSGS